MRTRFGTMVTASLLALSLLAVSVSAFGADSPAGASTAPAITAATPATPPAAAAPAAPAATLSAGDTAWVLAASALVLLMTPGLAFFYGGLVRKKNVLSIRKRLSRTVREGSSSGGSGYVEKQPPPSSWLPGLLDSPRSCGSVALMLRAGDSWFNSK